MFLNIAKEIIEDLKGNFGPKGSGYYVLKTAVVDKDTSINLVGNVTNVKDNNETYYSIYTIVEIDGGDDICDPDFKYVDNTGDVEKDTKALADKLQAIADLWDEEDLIKTYHCFIS